MKAQIISIEQLPAMASSAVVVVDVMRAFTTTAAALAQGANGAVLAGSPQEALQTKEQIPGSLALKDGAPATGFDGVNSPVMIERLDLAGRTVVLTTTSGTVGAIAAETADLLVCASFVVASATARYLRRTGHEVTFVATGDKGQAQEDRACASYIGELMAGNDVDPTPYLRQAAESPAATDLRRGVERGYLGVHQDDVARCLQVDVFDFAMVATRESHRLILRAVP